MSARPATAEIRTVVRRVVVFRRPTYSSWSLVRHRRHRRCRWPCDFGGGVSEGRAALVDLQLDRGALLPPPASRTRAAAA